MELSTKQALKLNPHTFYDQVISFDKQASLPLLDTISGIKAEVFQRALALTIPSISRLEFQHQWRAIGSTTTQLVHLTQTLSKVKEEGAFDELIKDSGVAKALRLMNPEQVGHFTARLGGWKDMESVIAFLGEQLTEENSDKEIIQLITRGYVGFIGVFFAEEQENVATNELNSPFLTEKLSTFISLIAKSRGLEDWQMAGMVTGLMYGVDDHLGRIWCDETSTSAAQSLKQTVAPEVARVVQAYSEAIAELTDTEQYYFEAMLLEAQDEAAVPLTLALLAVKLAKDLERKEIIDCFKSKVPAIYKPIFMALALSPEEFVEWSCSGSSEDQSEAKSVFSNRAVWDGSPVLQEKSRAIKETYIQKCLNEMTANDFLNWYRKLPSQERLETDQRVLNPQSWAKYPGLKGKTLIVQELYQNTGKAIPQFPLAQIRKVKKWSIQ